MKKYHVFILVVVLLATFATVSNAEESDVMTTTNTTTSEKTTMPLNASTKTLIAPRVGEGTPPVKMRPLIAPKLENLREMILQKQNEMKTLNGEKKQEFQTKLAELKDAKKKEVVTRIDEQLARINAKRVETFSNTLDRMDTIAAKILEKINTAKTAGQNTTAAELALTNAQTAITNAKAAVATQAAKEYKAEITTDATLRQTVGTAVSGLQSDLQTVKKALIDAKTALATAASEVAKLKSAAPTVTPVVTNSAL